MSNVPSLSPQPHDPANPPPPAGADEFALKVQEFWAKNRSAIFILIIAIFVALLGREGWAYYAEMRDRGVQEEYAKIGDRVEQLPKFAEANKGHALAGVAWLRVADDAYGKNDFKAAAAHYQKAADALEQTALKSRARLGAAVSQLAAGDKAAAESGLKALSSDAAATAALRAEATYHLAALAHEAGKDEDAKKFIEEITKIDGTGLWAQRGFMLRAQIESAKPASAPAPTTPAVQFKPGN
jgi:predicted negative regulator of RcsB-dependent stress response